MLRIYLQNIMFVVAVKVNIFENETDAENIMAKHDVCSSCKSEYI